MELHVVWNKIDQLEKVIRSLNDLVVLQAEEIGDLKRILKENNLVIRDHCENHHAAVGHRSMGPFLQTSNNNNNSNSILNSNSISPRQPHQNNVSTVNRNSSVPPMSHPYLMSSHVHPLSAIPPIAPKVIVNIPTSSSNSNNTSNGSQRGNLPQVYGVSNNSRMIHGSNNLRALNAPRLTKLTNTTSAALNRHSIHGTRLDSAFNLDTDEESGNDSSDNNNNNNNMRHKRQSFVEESSDDDDLFKDDMIDDDNDEQRIFDYDDNSGGSQDTIVDQEQQNNCKRLKQQDNNVPDSSETYLVSYTEPDYSSDSNLAEYLVGKVIEKNQLPSDAINTANEPPHVVYNFRKIERSPEEKLNDNQLSYWPWPTKVQKPILPDNLQRILENSPFR